MAQPENPQPPRPVPQDASRKPPAFPPNRVVREGDLPKR